MEVPVRAPLPNLLTIDQALAAKVSFTNLTVLRDHGNRPRPYLYEDSAKLFNVPPLAPAGVLGTILDTSSRLLFGPVKTNEEKRGEVSQWSHLTHPILTGPRNYRSERLADEAELQLARFFAQVDTMKSFGMNWETI